MKRPLIGLALAAAMVPAMVPAVSGLGAQAAATDECILPERVLARTDLPEGASVVACEAVGRRLLVANGVGVEVPPPGHGVMVSTLGVDHESSVVLTVEVTADGFIDYASHTASPLTAAATGTSPAACDDDAYGLLSFKWYTTFQWWINAGTKPANLTATQTQDAIKEGTSNITMANNDCGLVDDISATQAYQGLTTAGVDMYTQDGVVYCDSSANINGLSTVGFAGMPTNYLAATCTWRVTKNGQVAEAVESDIRINLNKAWTVTPLAAGCDQQYDLEYVVTHERGHTFGLADLSGDHDKLTMYESGRTCSAAGRTLGLGDIKGLRQRY